jgi:predicted ATPase/transcriptional regulator with XRE-family HTH domain
VENSVSFGYWLSRQRKALDLTQHALADLVGYSVATLKKIEADERRPSRQMAEQLADYLGIPDDQRAIFIECARGLRPMDRMPLTREMVPGPNAPRPSNLPTPLTPLIGREAEAAAVKRYISLPGTRLLTLTGPPGIGKTRLSIQVASELCPDFDEGIYFIPLAPLTTPDLVPRALSQILGINESEERSLVSALINYIQSKPMLLVLDNFEHLLAAAPILVEVLQACPRLKILATSRSALNVSGEHQYPVSPLLLPDTEGHLSLETLAEYPSIILYVNRAQATDPYFTLTEANAYAVAEICSKLDGLPLAIELAAAHTRLLKPQELLTRLNHRLSLLSGGPTDLPPRQRTLRAAIRWSYDLLDNREQIIFSRLAVFLGGWTLEAAEAITMQREEHPEGAGDVFATLSALVDKSLVQKSEPAQMQARFTMLETIREYALEKLEQQGEIEMIRKRHSDFFLKLAEDSEPALRSPKQQDWLNRLDEEHNNLRAALQWNLDRGDSETALKLVGALWRYWWMHNYFHEGRSWLEKALNQAEPSPTSWRARALNGAGILARSQGDYAGAQTYLEACLEIQKTQADPVGVANVLNSLGLLAYVQGDHVQAAKIHEQALAYRRNIGDQRGIAISLNNLALSIQETGDFDQAELLFRESLDLSRQVGDTRGVSAAIINLGATMLDQGLAEQADGLYREALLFSKGLKDQDGIIQCLEGLAGVASLQQRPERAARLLGAALALRSTIGLPVHPFNRLRYQRIEDSIKKQLPAEAIASQQAIGKEMTLDRAIDYALQKID